MSTNQEPKELDEAALEKVVGGGGGGWRRQSKDSNWPPGQGGGK